MIPGYLLLVARGFLVTALITDYIIGGCVLTHGSNDRKCRRKTIFGDELQRSDAHNNTHNVSYIYLLPAKLNKHITEESHTYVNEYIQRIINCNNIKIISIFEKTNQKKMQCSASNSRNYFYILFRPRLGPRAYIRVSVH